MSAHAASGRLKISMSEAQDLIDKFFSTFPKIENKLKALANFGVKKGFIIEPVLGRPRFYDDWRLAVIGKLNYKQVNSYVSMSYNEIKEAEKQKASIERESKNHPIQGAGASILKISGVLMRRYIYNHNFENSIRLLLPVHDEWVTEAEDQLAPYWANTLKHYMELAGQLGLKSDLLKAEPYIDNHWIKD